MKLSRCFFLDQKTYRGLGVHVKEATRTEGVPPPLWAPRDSTDLFLPPTYSQIPKTFQGSHQTTFPLPQPSVPVRSHLGAFSGVLPEGNSIMEGFYVNTITSPMKHEQFTTDLRVHSQQLDGFFSLFDSKYHVLLDVLGDLFDVIFFCGVFAKI